MTRTLANAKKSRGHSGITKQSFGTYKTTFWEVEKSPFDRATGEALSSENSSVSVTAVEKDSAWCYSLSESQRLQVSDVPDRVCTKLRDRQTGDNGWVKSQSQMTQEEELEKDAEGSRGARGLQEKWWEGPEADSWVENWKKTSVFRLLPRWSGYPLSKTCKNFF